MTTPTPAPAPRPRRQFRLWLALLAVLVVPALLFTLYMGSVFAFAYSEGERAGILQKFSR